MSSESNSSIELDKEAPNNLSSAHSSNCTSTKDYDDDHNSVVINPDPKIKDEDENADEQVVDAPGGGKNEEEIYRLAGRPPLITILHLMIGPIISQVTGALYGIINSIWISHGIGETGLSAIATEMTLEGIGRAFGFFLMISASTKISQLFGQNMQEEATQVVCDLLRCTVVCGAFVPAVILPSHNAMCRWFGASEETIKLGFSYILPLSAFSVFTCINLCCQGFLQAEGRTLLIGFIDFTSLVVACGGICPLFMYGFKTGINAASIATVLADGIPGVTLMILYFRGKFGIKPRLNQLLKPFSKHTGPALVVGLSQLVSNLAGCIPGIPIRNLIGMSSGNTHVFDLAMAGFNVCCRFFQFSSCVCIAVTTGFIAAGSYAYASKNYIRYMRLAFHAAWIAFAWSVIITIFALVIPKQISMIFADGSEYLEYAEPILRNSNYAGFVRWVQFNCQAMLQSLQNGTLAMLVSFLANFVAFLGFGYMLFYTNKHDVKRLMYLYSLTMAFGTVVGIALLSGPLLKVYRLAKLQKSGGDKSVQDIEENYLENIEEKSTSDSKSSTNTEAKNVTEM